MESVKIYEDNSGAVEIAKYSRMKKNFKYIEVYYKNENELWKKNN